ncbi:hypothetical protein QMP26_05380 [Enterocloster clostridioformis]|uniref:hypothetical protein n=1 Tax=Enterocloster clostridioformis TaxID=1531 RepID=UPI0026754172|nr:hypothetical protein [Enterocloster clostridioformis]
MKWIKVDNKGNPVKRSGNTFIPHDYSSEDGTFLIVNNSFTETKLPWVLTCGNKILGKFKTLKAAKEAVEITLI